MDVVNSFFIRYQLKLFKNLNCLIGNFRISMFRFKASKICAINVCNPLSENITDAPV